ncbi:MAG TPA: carboxypeptidase-like regulatory domain-containing protein [Thermoleophilia bacterium]|nr:carboxypeptidase-like regulatory domain-containing protein [Thermoleophilia bacterium]
MGPDNDGPDEDRTLRRGAFLSGARLVVVAVVVALAAGIIVALAVWPANKAPSDSGVRGLVLLGPIDPVEQVGGPPNERPYEATLRVVRAGSDDTVATVRSGADGRFTVNLAPGDYTLVPEAQGDSMLPYASPVDVTVVAHRFTSVTVYFDSGVR